MSDPILSAPAGLSIDARRLWDTYAAGWVLDEHAQVLLRFACETFDRMLEAQKQIKQHGYRPLPKGAPNPYVIERDCRRDLLKMLRGLGVSLDALPDGVDIKGRRS